jgi:hypothetical protein
MGSISLGTLMVADDLAILSESTPGMHSLVNEAAADASREI